MTAAAWAELLVLIALLAISTPLLGTYMAKVYGGKRAPGDRVFLPVERDLPPHRRRSRERAALADVRALAARVQLRIGAHPVRAAPAARTSAVQPRPPGGREADAVVQHGRQLPHEHQLAELLRRVDDVAPHPDGRPRGAQLRLGGRRCRRRGRADPRTGAAAHAHARQLLGRPRPHDDPHPAPAGVRVRARAREPGGRPELPRRQVRHDGGRSVADPARRADREPGGDQGDRRERRRPVQRQLGAPVREPEPDHEHPPDLDAARDPVRVPVDVREDGRRR